MTAGIGSRSSLASRALLFLGAALALSHLANDWARLDPPYGPAWKASGIFVLGLYALSERAWLAGLGLILSSLGDVLLELDGLFVGGMAAFGLAHVCYAVAFGASLLRDGRRPAGLLLAALALAASAAMLVWMRPGMDALLAPSLVYQGVITVMVALALLSRASARASFGACLFMLSDSLIAAEMFRSVDIPPGAVWITYALAQILLALGLVRARS